MSETLRVLVVDDDRRIAKTIVDILKVKGYESEEAHSAAEALNMVKENSFDCVLTDIKMPRMNGVELHQAIKEARPELPVVFMTAYSTDALVKQGLEQGALATLTKPLDVNLLLSFLSALRKEHTIVIVDDDPAFCETMGDILQARGFAVTQVSDPHDWEENIKPAGQIVLLDMKLNAVSGLDILKQIREKYPHFPAIMVTGYRGEMASSIEKALSISAYTCLYKPLEIEKLLQVLNELRHKELGRILGQPVRKKG